MRRLLSICVRYTHPWLIQTFDCSYYREEILLACGKSFFLSLINSSNADSPNFKPNQKHEEHMKTNGNPIWILCVVFFGWNCLKMIDISLVSWKIKDCLPRCYRISSSIKISLSAWRFAAAAAVAAFSCLFSCADCHSLLFCTEQLLKITQFPIMKLFCKHWTIKMRIKTRLTLSHSHTHTTQRLQFIGCNCYYYCSY